MFIGSFSIGHPETDLQVLEYAQKLTCPGIEFCRINIPGFEGGYFRNKVFQRMNDAVFFFDEKRDIAVIIDGNIYNSSELPDSSGSDIPVLLAGLFLKHGPGFAEKLNGDFSICIIRPSKQEVFLIRDQIGINPIAWTHVNNRLIFSSDITGLCRVIYGLEPVNIEYQMGYLKYIDNRKTANPKVKRLLPGHYLSFSENGVKEFIYWDPRAIKTDMGLTYERMMYDLKFLVSDSVRIRCDHNYIAGAHFSSGLDSGIVAAFARKEYSGQECFYGISWSPPDFNAEDVKYDERNIIRISAGKANIIPLFTGITNEDFPRFVSSFYENRGYFSEDRASDIAKERGINIIFSGWGGDEFVSSGDRGIDLDLLKRMKVGMFFRRNPLNNFKSFFRNILFYVICPAFGILDRATSQAFRDEARYLRKPYKKSDAGAIRNFYFHRSRRQMHLRMLRFYHLQERCESWIINGFRKGIEYRFPLLDRRIIEYMLKVPSELLCVNPGSRPLLREIGKEVIPDEIRLNKRKDDPVYWQYMKALFRFSANSFIKEIPGWKTNPDMQFIDFKMLESDALKPDEKMEDTDNEILCRSLVYLKSINEFSKRYRA